MADAGATATGLKELATAVDRLPVDVTAALRAVASVTAGRIQRRAFEIVASKVKRGASVVAITIQDDGANKAFVVIAEGAHDKPANLALWIERGTRYIEPRPFLRPAADAEDARYKAASLAAAEAVVDKLGSL